MPLGNGYSEVLVTQQGDGTALTNTTTATSILNTQAKFPLWPYLLANIGQKLRVKAAGRISTVVTTPGTLTLDIRFGAIIVANGGAMTLSTTAKTNVAWELEWDLLVRSVGASTAATLMHQGHFISEAAGATTVAGEAKTILLPQSAPAVGTGFDSTISNIIDMFATWSVANASNSIQVHQFELSRLV